MIDAASLATMRAAIASESGFVVTPQGNSMYPMLRDGRDSVRIIPVQTPLRRGDLILYLRADGTPVLHRVRAVTERGLTICGDGQTVCEYGVSPDAVLGIVIGFWRGTRYTPVTALRYRMYLAIWCASLRLRRIFQMFIKPRKSS